MHKTSERVTQRDQVSEQSETCGAHTQLAAKDTSEKRSGGKLIVLGQTPPPYHGQAVAIQVLIEGLRDKVDLVHVPMRFSETVDQNGQLRLRKVWHLVSVLFRSISLLIRNRGATLYYPPAPASWVPVLRDLALLSFLRPLAGQTVFHLHAHGLGSFLESRPWLRNWTWAWSKPDVVMIHGESCADDARKFQPGRIAIAPYGVDVPRAHRQRPPEKKIRVLYVGMHAESKGIFDLLETASLLRDLDIEFRTVGSFKYPETQPRFEEQVRRLGLEGVVDRRGQRIGDQLWQEYADADIFFFPTFYESESFGVVTVEAMAHALPVVASNWPGPSDIVEHETTGFLCETRNVHEYSMAIRKLAENPDLRFKMGAAGERLYRDKYTLGSFVARMQSVFGTDDLRGWSTRAD